MIVYNFNDENFEYEEDFFECKDKLIDLLVDFVKNNKDITGNIETEIVRLTCKCLIEDTDIMDKLEEQFVDELKEAFKDDAYLEYKNSKLAQDPYNYYGVDKSEFL